MAGHLLQGFNDGFFDVIAERGMTDPRCCLVLTMPGKASRHIYDAKSYMTELSAID